MTPRPDARVEPADRAAVLRAAADDVEALRDRREAEERNQHGFLDHESELQGAAIRDVIAHLRRRADEAIKAEEPGGRCTERDLPLPLPQIGRGDQVVVEYDGKHERYQVSDIPYRARPGSISITLRHMPLVLARAVRTCIAVPSQWNAWTASGQYLYLCYRSGIGTVDAYDSPDVEKWTRIPDGQVTRFDTGDRLDGEMDLPEFCERAGLELADDAEVIGE